MSFKYDPDKEQKVHAQGAIQLLCKPFQTHEAGLPEWAKNAADAYSYEASSRPMERDDRVVLLLLSDRKALGPPRIGCLDLVGTTSDLIEQHFRHWGSPDAATRGGDGDAQGGHGNGGKCYMTQLFTDHAVFHTVRDSVGCRYGVKGGSTNFGYVPNKKMGRNFTAPDKEAALNGALAEFGLSLDQLPPVAQAAYKKSSGFSLVYGVAPKHFDKRLKAKQLIGEIRDHPQMQTTMAFCHVIPVHNGKVLAGCDPLLPSEITPIPGADEVRVVKIPDELIDPADGQAVSTTAGGKENTGELHLFTSQKSMRWSKKARHTINYKSPHSGYIGFRSMHEFEVSSGFVDKIYGECTLATLEPFTQNDRRALAEAPLTRAVEHFLSQEIEKYAKEFEGKEKQDFKKKERNELSRINEALDRWKNQFLEKLAAGAFGPGGGGPGPNPPLPKGTPTRIEIANALGRLGIGVAIRPRIRFFDKENKQVQPVTYRWVSEDTNVAMVDDDLMLINSFSPGETIIYAETTDGQLKSNRVPIEVVKIRSIEITPAEVEVSHGGKTSLTAVCTLSDSTTATDVALIWTEADASIARVSTSGVIFGGGIGETEIYAGDDKVLCNEPAKVKVTEGSGGGTGGGQGGNQGAGNSQGKGFPRILVSGKVDPDPETGDEVHFSSDDPPIMQRPQDVDRNIWWLNSAAPLARLYLDREAGFGYDTREWRMYHLERYVDIMAQIAVTYDPLVDGQLTAGEFFQDVASRVAEIQAAVIADLKPFIQDGEMPEDSDA